VQLPWKGREIEGCLSFKGFLLLRGGVLQQQQQQQQFSHTVVFSCSNLGPTGLEVDSKVQDPVPDCSWEDYSIGWVRGRAEKVDQLKQTNEEKGYILWFLAAISWKLRDKG
jgi:hypothetical protein